MKKREPVSKIMSTELVTVDRHKHNLKDVKVKFEKGKIRHIPVMEGENLTGIISKNDIMRLSFGSLFDGGENSDAAVFDMLSIDQVMTHKPKTVDADTPIRDVAEMLVKEKFHSLPVTQEGKLAGIVTSTDIIGYLLEQY